MHTGTARRNGDCRPDGARGIIDRHVRGDADGTILVRSRNGSTQNRKLEKPAKVGDKYISVYRCIERADTKISSTLLVKWSHIGIHHVKFDSFYFVDARCIDLTVN